MAALCRTTEVVVGAVAGITANFAEEKAMAWLRARRRRPPEIAA